MRISLNRNKSGQGGASPRPRGRRWARLGAGAFLFFTLKGVVWLTVGGLALAGVL